MARLRGALGSLRACAANCSVRTAFALYAAAAMLAGLALSVVASGLLGYLAEASLPEDPYAHAGYYVLDADAGELVPAEALSWYETPAYDAVAERGAGGGDSVVLYVASRSDSGRLPVPLDDPPAGVRDGSAQDLALLMDEEDAAGIPFGEIAAYDASASAARPGSEAAEALAAELPANADGERPVVSNVGYYLPYPKDPQPYRLAAWAAVASVPAAFVACVVVAGRRFYRARLEGPIAAIDEAARRIAASDLDFCVEPARDDELGRLCGQIEAMRAELERTEGELWRAAEGRRQVNAAFAHDLRTPLTVIRGQAELVGRLSGDAPVRAAAAAIGRQADRLSDFAESMRGLDDLEAAEVAPEPMDPGAWLDAAASDALEVARGAGVALSSSRDGLPPLVEADARALSRIADNLVANAARYARSEVRISLSWEGGELALAVSDDGPGFGEAALERAADPFWGESKGSGGHMGLGLYVARSLAARHGGSLELSNAPGGGAVALARLRAPEPAGARGEKSRGS